MRQRFKARSIRVPALVPILLFPVCAGIYALAFYTSMRSADVSLLGSLHPSWILAATGVLVLVVLVQSLVQVTDMQGERAVSLRAWLGQHRQMIGTVGLIGAYCFTLGTLGFFVSTGCYVALQLRALRYRRLGPTIVLAVTVPFFLWLLMGVALGQRMPTGMWGI